MVRALAVTIEREGAAIDRIERLPRRLPDGSIGVEYMGLVYPLIAAGRASLDGRWCYASEAPICLEPPADLPEEATRFWSLDRSGTRPYLFVNGSEALLGVIVERMRSAGVAVEHFGPSFREGASGLLHDWFVRLAAGDSLTDWEVGQLLADVSVAPSESDEPASSELALTRIRRDYERLAQRLIDAERELAEAIARADKLFAELEQRRVEAARVEAKLATDIAFLRAGIAALERGQDQQAPTAELAELQARVDALAADRDSALGAWTEAEARVDELRQALEAARADAAEAAVRRTPAPSPTPAMGARRQQRAEFELETVLRQLLPGIELVRASANFVLTEIEDRRDLYTKLKLLLDDPVAMGGKRVHAADGWLEVHLGTGRGRDGRLYYKRRGTNWSVLVSDKAAQPNDFQWLKAQ